MTPTRRRALAAGVALLAAPKLFARNRAESVGVAVVGCGTRGTELALEIARQGHAIAALCDIAPFRLDALERQLPPDSRRLKTDELRRALDLKGVDAVVIATPDHHHKAQFLATLAAGKDVYVETPLSKSLDEHAEFDAAARKADRVIQVGLQRRSSAAWEESLRLSRARDFGKLVRATAWDGRDWQAGAPFAPPPGFKADAKSVDWGRFLGTAPKRDPDAHRYWAWRTYWDYAGGLLSDWGTAAADLISWAGPADVPNSVAVNGGRYFFEHWELPDTVEAAWDYGSFSAGTSSECANASRGSGLRLHGTRQTLVAEGSQIRLYGTAGPLDAGTKPLRTWTTESETPAHVKNWLDCVKSRGTPNAPVVLGLRVAVAAHLAALSYRTGRKQFFDAERGEVVGG